MASSGNDVLNESLLQCSICFEDLSAEIMICPTGHSLCKGCFDKLDPRDCPFCKISMGRTRNQAVERFLNKLGHGKMNWLNDSVTSCSHCSQIMDSHIGVCRLGHSSCEGCTKKNKMCKICFSRIDIQRNFLLESCIRKIKKEKHALPNPCQIFKENHYQKKSNTIICPLPVCSFKSDCLSDHIATAHKNQTVFQKSNCLLRICVKNFSEKHLILRVSEHFFIIRVKVSHTFMMINALQITKGSEYVLYIEHQGTHPIEMYKFKYTCNGNSKKIILKTESLTVSKLGEYVVKISIAEKKSCGKNT